MSICLDVKKSPVCAVILQQYASGCEAPGRGGVIPDTLPGNAGAEFGDQAICPWSDNLRGCCRDGSVTSIMMLSLPES
jgi:hypothetical protein